MTEPRLSDEDVASAMTELPLWRREGDTITRTVTAPDFLTGIGYVTKVATAAEDANHHPDIDVRWRDVTFRLSTRDAGGLTRLDMVMAKQVDSITS